MFFVTGGYDSSNLNIDGCKAACAAVTDGEIAGVTNSNVCLCGKEDGACE